MVWVGRLIRIPLPPSSAHRKRFERTPAGKKIAPDPSAPVLRAVPATLRIRRAMKREAARSRSPFRWTLLLVAWGAGGVFAFASVSDVATGNFAGMLAMPAGWFAAFGERWWHRALAAASLAALGLFAQVTGTPVWPGTALLVAGLGLVGGAIPSGRRTVPR